MRGLKSLSVIALMFCGTRRSSKASCLLLCRVTAALLSFAVPLLLPLRPLLSPALRLEHLLVLAVIELQCMLRAHADLHSIPHTLLQDHRQQHTVRTHLG